MDARPSLFEHSRFPHDRADPPASNCDAAYGVAPCGTEQGRASAAPGEPRSGAASCPSSPGEWIRIFATWFARREPGLSAEAVLTLAINEFKVSHSVPPEQAAERYRG